MRFNLYDLLRLHRTANLSAIRSAYRRAALLTHPDKGGTSGDFLATVEAFETLSDPERREAYDRQLQACSLNDGLAPGPLPPDPPSAPGAAAAGGRAQAATGRAATARRAARRTVRRPGQRGRGATGAAAAAEVDAAEETRQTQPPPQPPPPSQDSRREKRAPSEESGPGEGGADCPGVWEELQALGDEEQEEQQQHVQRLTFKTLVALLSWIQSARRRRRKGQAKQGEPSGIAAGSQAPSKRRGSGPLALRCEGGAAADASEAAHVAAAAAAGAPKREPSDKAPSAGPHGGKAGVAKDPAAASSPSSSSSSQPPPSGAPSCGGRPPSTGLRGVKRRVRFRGDLGSGPAAAATTGTAATKRQRAESTLPKSRGVHHAHGKSHQDYMASVGWHAFYISTLSTKSIADAVDWHIDLVNLKQLAKQRIREGWGFDEAVEATVAETLAARKAEGKSVPVLRFASFMSYHGKKISLPLADLDIALRQRNEMMALRASGAALSDMIDAKDRLVIAARDRRRLLAVQARAARRAARPPDRRLFMQRRSAPTVRVTKLAREQLRVLRKALRVQLLEPGLDAVELCEGPSKQVYVYAELFASAPSPDAAAATAQEQPASSGEAPANAAAAPAATPAVAPPLCKGPLRTAVAEAARDLAALRLLQGRLGDGAACAEAQRLDLEVMTARFMSGSQ